VPMLLAQRLQSAGDFPAALDWYWLLYPYDIAQPVSIYDQLMTIHRENPSIQDTVLEKSVRFQSFDLTEMTCPAIKVQIEKLKSLPVQLPDMNLDYIILHPVIHAFYINGTDGDVRLSLTDSRHTLVRWARQTREALDACGRAR